VLPPAAKENNATNNGKGGWRSGKGTNYNGKGGWRGGKTANYQPPGMYMVCWRCKRPGHIAKECPQRPALAEQKAKKTRVEQAPHVEVHVHMH
jgi:hypothetical protein